MKLRYYSVLAVALLLVCLSAGALAIGSGAISPWLLNMGEAKWGPVPADRLETRVLHTNGNIMSKYHPNTGVLYHSYIGNPEDHVISDTTFNRVVIKPPAGAAYRADFYCDGAALDGTSYQFKYCISDPEMIDQINVSSIREAVKSPRFTDDILDPWGPPYYDWNRSLFAKKSNVCTPKQRASQGRCNVYLAAWYNAAKQLIRVDWLAETSDDFSIPKKPISGHIFDGYASEADLPDRITRPSLIIPPSRENMKFRLGLYYYPNYRGNTDFAELYLMQEERDLIVPDYDEGPVVFYWPYPQGYSYTSPVHYQLKHYLDNTRTRFELLNVTPTPKGLRIESNSFSPFEMTWTEVKPESLPGTGDHTSIALWMMLMLASACGVWLMRKRTDGKNVG